MTGETNVELRKLRYFLRIVDLGSMGKAGAVFYRSAQLVLRHADEGGKHRAKNADYWARQHRVNTYYDFSVSDAFF